MAQIIDFEKAKELIENRNNTGSKRIDRPTANFSVISERNKQAKEKIKKEREQANKNVMKSYRIK